jgi:type VI secretion system protein ImpL
MIFLLVGVAALVLALVWTAVLALQANLLWGVAATTLFALAGLLALLLRRGKTAPKTKKQGPEPDPDSDPRAAAAMRSAVDRSLQFLRSSKLGGGALSLPWFLVLGPRAAGKTTLLSHSGLSFPLGPPAIAGRGPTSTSPCDFWMCNEAVLVDASGRYLSDDGARAEWLSFLDHLRRSRSNTPVDGVLLTLSAAELMRAGDEAMAALGKRLRLRLDELAQRMDAVVPVYLVATKVDALPGFLESFADYRRAERVQPWGFTLDGAPGPSPRAALEARFDELVETAQARALFRMVQERDPSARERIYELPQQLQALRGPLGCLAEELLAPSPFQDPPLVRGVFFTSAGQDGAAVDGVMAAAAQRLGLAAPAPAASPVAQSKSFFIHDLVAKVAAGEVGLRRPSARRQRRHLLATYGLVALGFLVSLLLTLPPLVAFLRNRDLLQSLSQAGQAAAAPSESVELAMERLGPLRDSLERLEEHAKGGPPLGMAFGMYQGEKVRPAASAAFATAVRDRLLAPLLRDDLALLAAFSQRFRGGVIPPVDAAYSEALAALKLHLLLSSPRAQGEPGLREAEQAFAWGRLSDLWKRRSGANASASARDAVERNLRLYLRLAAREAGFGVAREVDLVANARGVLARAPYEDLALERLVAAADGPTYALELSSLIGQAGAGLRSERKVRGAFTRRGYEEVIRARLATSAADDDGWVLGDQRGPQDRARVQRRYFERYIAAWRELISSLEVERPESSAQALELLQWLTRGEPPPLLRLFKAVAFNVQLASDAEKKARAAVEGAKDSMLGKAREMLGASAAEEARAAAATPTKGPEALGPAEVESAFAGFVGFAVPAPPSDPSAKPPPTGLDLYQELLIGLRDALQRELDSPGDGAALASALGSARTKVMALVGGQAIGWRPALDALVWPVLEALVQTSKRERLNHLNARWCSTVVAPFEAKPLARAFPFAADGPDASMADFAEFYRPETGTLWRFVQSELKDDLERAGERHQFKHKAGGAAAFEPELLEYLDRARDVSSALFPPGSADPSVSLSASIRPAPNVSQVWLEVDGQLIEYRNGPEETHALKWPNPARTGRSAVRVRTPNGGEQEVHVEGEWSFLRLLAAAAVRPLHGRAFAASWHFGGAATDVEVVFQTARTEAPFFDWRGHDKHLFHLFRHKGLALPRDIAAGAKSCPAAK